MNWYVLTITAILGLGLILFLIRGNRKDEKVFEERMNNDFHKRTTEGDDIDIEE